MSSWKTPENLVQLRGVASTVGITFAELETILDIAESFIDALRLIISKCR